MICYIYEMNISIKILILSLTLYQTYSQPLLSSDFKIIYDLEIQYVLETVLIYLTNRYHKIKRNQFSVYVIESDTFNAWVNIGKNKIPCLYITTGLLKKSTSFEEIIGIIAHELGHIYNNDNFLLEYLAKQNIIHSTISLSMMLAFYGLKIMPFHIAANIHFLHNIYLLKKFHTFSLFRELSADQFSFRTLKRLKFPYDIKNIHLKFHENDFEINYENIEQTHPRSKDRAEFAQIAENHFKDKFGKFIEPLRLPQELKDMGKLMLSRVKQGLYEKSKTIKLSSKASNYEKAYYHFLQKNYKLALDYIKKIINTLEKAPNSFQYDRCLLLGSLIYFKSGKIPQAIKHLDKTEITDKLLNAIWVKMQILDWINKRKQDETFNPSIELQLKIADAIHYIDGKLEKWKLKAALSDLQGRKFDFYMYQAKIARQLNQKNTEKIFINEAKRFMTQKTEFIQILDFNHYTKN